MYVITHDRNAVAQDLAGNGSADRERLTRIGFSIAIGSGHEFVRIVADEKNGATLDRNDLEDHLQHTCFEVLRLSDSAYSSADFQKCGQVTCHPCAGRQCCHDLFRPHVDRVILVEFNGDGRYELLFPGIGERHIGNVDVVFEQKDELRNAHLDTVSVLEFLFVGRKAVDECAVQAFQVGNSNLPPAIPNGAVLSREERIVDRHLV